MSEFSVDIQGIHSLGIDQRRLDKNLESIAAKIQSRLIAAAPRGRGPAPHMADMFQVQSLQRMGTESTLSIINTKIVTSRAGAQYSLWSLISTGTSSHPILGNPILHFMIGGQDIFTSRVQHPGTRPNPFVKRTLDQIGHIEYEQEWSEVVYGKL